MNAQKSAAYCIPPTCNSVAKGKRCTPTGNCGGRGVLHTPSLLNYD